jgi:hypothetical protein
MHFSGGRWAAPFLTMINRLDTHSLGKEAHVEHPVIETDAYSNESQIMPPGDYLVYIHKTAMYVFTRGAPFFLIRHFKFLEEYVAAWLDKHPDPEDVAEAFVGRKAYWRLRIMTRFLQAEWIPSAARPWVPWTMVISLAFSLVIILPVQFGWSVVSSAWHVIKKGIRSVPPLITAVVVVFVTSDAWRILGTGFTPRFFALVCLFLLAGLLFLIRFKDYWEYDIAASGNAAGLLLRGVKRKKSTKFYNFVDQGAEPTPMVKPTGFGAVVVYSSYALLSAFSLIAAAMFVAGALILVGMILISAQETVGLAHSVHIYRMLPGHVVITRQLVSLSLSLGAFSAFFLVAAQHTEDRRVFMDNILVRLRRALLVYSVYCDACNSAPDWTGILVNSAAADREPRGRREIREAAQRVAERRDGSPGSALPSPTAQARSIAISWAREVATARDLKYVAYYAGPADDFRAPSSLLSPFTAASVDIAAKCISYPGLSEWNEFQAAARQVWEAVEHSNDQVLTEPPPTEIQENGTE